MTVAYATIRRRIAVQESRVLRGYARWGAPVPSCARTDHWGEYTQACKANGSSFGARAA